MVEILGSVRRLGLISAQIEVDKALCGPHRGDQRADAEDVHNALEIVGQHESSSTASAITGRSTNWDLWLLRPVSGQ
jgi:hypothetical protein